MVRYLPFLLILAMWIYAFIDCLNTPENEVRKLPKVAWVLIILLFGQVLMGPIAWFAVGRPRRNAPYGATRANERTWVAPDDNPDFLKSIEDDADGRTRGPAASRAPQDPGDPRNTPQDNKHADDTELFKEWEADLRRREDDIRRKDADGGSDDTPPRA